MVAGVVLSSAKLQSQTGNCCHWGSLAFVCQTAARDAGFERLPPLWLLVRFVAWWLSLAGQAVSAEPMTWAIYTIKAGAAAGAVLLTDSVT